MRPGCSWNLVCDTPKNSLPPLVDYAQSLSEVESSRQQLEHQKHLNSLLQIVKADIFLKISVKTTDRSVLIIRKDADSAMRNAVNTFYESEGNVEARATLWKSAN